MKKKNNTTSKSTIEELESARINLGARNHNAREVPSLVFQMRFRDGMPLKGGGGGDCNTLRIYVALNF